MDQLTQINGCDLKYFDKKQIQTTKAIREYLISHLDEKVSLEQLAKEAHLNLSVFHLVFSHIYGDTPYAYLKKYKMNLAAQWLSEDKMKIGDIALELGYSNASKFAKAVDKELEGYQAKLKEVDLNKTRLEREIDSLPADAKYRERKLHDMTLRLDSLYDVIVELEEKIEDARLRRDAIKQQAITLENIYKIMVNFDCVYNIINDEEKRNVVTALIKEIEIYRNDESEYPLKRIGLNFPVFKDGGEVTELLWDKGNTVETVALLNKLSE